MKIATVTTIVAMILVMGSLVLAQAQDMKDSESVTDYHAVWATLQAMIKAGELSEEEAEDGMTAIKKVKQSAVDWKPSKIGTATYYEGMWAALQAMVKTGELTEEEAEAKMIVNKKELRSKMAAMKKP